ncbi:MAG TPA: phenylalanine--tRNA ligase subunit alpha [Rhodospirillaceae bacterium]|nr:MAG: phenylalanine--tRNA ligase subunit alpha [Alphaproteobacteria bacterium GWF2_58_20]HAU29738.1 phenylalanine--tRNA ligase subunit alpha [Rhodospirillaceae bacterium]
MDNLEQLVEDILKGIAGAADMAALEEIRVAALGKKGSLTGLMKTLGGMDGEARKVAGQALNVAKDRVSEALDMRTDDLRQAAMAARLAGEKMDISLPVRPETAGRIHPLTQATEEVMAIFAEMGFSVAEGPDIEDDFHNFEALNIPADHPARQMQATFFMPPGADGKPKVLRTHTSPVQVRTMEQSQPPLRVICPGRTYRYDSDATHAPMFSQCEALWIDESVTMAQLKGCIMDFLRAFFGISDLPVRFRPSFFPFTEPSAEVDIGCSRKNGELKLGAGGDWLEVMGCGMVNAKVLQYGGIDPNRYQGFALGMGLERLAMLKYGIPDLRTFFECDLRWLKHYGFVPLDIPNVALGISG